MLITSRRPLTNEGTLTEYRESGDKFHMLHTQPVEHIFSKNKELRKEKVRPSAAGGWKKIGSIPALLLVRHPEWLHDSAALEKFLASSEGRPYRTVERI